MHLQICQQGSWHPSTIPARVYPEFEISDFSWWRRSLNTQRAKPLWTLWNGNSSTWGENKAWAQVHFHNSWNEDNCDIPRGNPVEQKLSPSACMIALCCSQNWHFFQVPFIAYLEFILRLTCETQHNWKVLFCHSAFLIWKHLFLHVKCCF